MAMTTLLRLGRADRGRPLTLDEFLAADYEGGYKYELIDGKLYVSPLPNAPEGLVERWIYRKLDRYADDHPDVLKLVYNKARVFVSERDETTVPEPDVAAYRDFPTELPLAEIRWEDVSPILTVEVLSAEEPDKDLVRNAELYFQVASIKEYWILDAREDAEHPRLIVHRRYGKRWVIHHYAPDSTYTTRLLPGFALILNVRS
jgi:Uma2 family endonuclease